MGNSASNEKKREEKVAERVTEPSAPSQHNDLPPSYNSLHISGSHHPSGTTLSCPPVNPNPIFHSPYPPHHISPPPSAPPSTLPSDRPLYPPLPYHHVTPMRESSAPFSVPSRTVVSARTVPIVQQTNNSLEDRNRNLKCSTTDSEQNSWEINLEFLLDLSLKQSSIIIDTLMKKKEMFMKRIKGFVSPVWITVLMKIIRKIYYDPQGTTLVKEFCCDEFLATLASYLSDVSTEYTGDDALALVTDVIRFLSHAQAVCNTGLLKGWDKIVIKTSQAVHGLQIFHGMEIDDKMKEKLGHLEKSFKGSNNVQKMETKYNNIQKDAKSTVERQAPFTSAPLVHPPFRNSFPMKPDIAQLLDVMIPHNQMERTLLPQSRVDGMIKDIFFVHLTDHRVNKKSSELYMVILLAKYLLNRKYKKQDLILLTNSEPSKQQATTLINKTPQLKDLAVKVIDDCSTMRKPIVLLLLMFYGHQSEKENTKNTQYVINAIGGAQEGLYMFGDMDLLEKNHIMWKKMKNTLLKENAIQPHLTLKCSFHPQFEVKLSSEALSSVGCSTICGRPLPCGHKCKRKCHADDKNHKHYDCHEPCDRKAKNCSQNHRCTEQCHKACALCQISVKHNGQWIRCCDILSADAQKGEIERKFYPQNKSTSDEKTVMVYLPCNHKQTVPLSQSNMISKLKCKEKCGSHLPCGHFCLGTCGQCKQGREHIACGETITLTLLCGHSKRTSCSKPSKECEEECLYKCLHGKCTAKCGARCIPCKEKCTMYCKHSMCTKLCFEPCDSEPCQKVCYKLLPCGHPCIGFCGEPCPRWCRVCNEDKLSKWDRKGNTRFVVLKDCNHSTRANELDKICRTKTQDLELLTCPLPFCGKAITGTRRYMNYTKMYYKELYEKNVREHMKQ